MRDKSVKRQMQQRETNGLWSLSPLSSLSSLASVENKIQFH